MEVERTILEKLWVANPYELEQEYAEQIQFQKQIEEYGH